MKINMTHKKEESLIQAVIRAIKNATANNMVVVLTYDIYTSLVYPNDNPLPICQYFKTLEITDKIAMLEERMQKT